MTLNPVYGMNYHSLERSDEMFLFDCYLIVANISVLLRV